MAETAATVFVHVRPATEIAFVTLTHDRPDSHALAIGLNVSLLGSAADLQRIARAIDAGLASRETAAPAELQRVADADEAERFRRELERDARIPDEDQ